MSDFDPYHKWLGISPQHQPPNHYRLLSLDLYESDPDVIEGSVDRLVEFLQDVALGPQAKESQRLLNEIAAVRLCLLDTTQKAAYDEKLAAELARTIGPPGDLVEPPPPPSAAPAIVIDTGADSAPKPPPVHKPTAKRPAVTAAPKRAASSSTDKTTKRGKRIASPLLVLSFISGGGLLIFAIVFALFAGGDSEAKRQAAEEARIRERLDSFAEMGREAESMIPDFQPQLDYSPPPVKKSKKKRKKK